MSRYRYLSQVRQEVGIRLLTRIYPGGVGPSKVCGIRYMRLSYISSSSFANNTLSPWYAVLAELLEAEIHGEKSIDYISQCLFSSTEPKALPRLHEFVLYSLSEVLFSYFIHNMLLS
jgi:hypothetical protein